MKQFLFDCGDGCSGENPCATCLAQALLAEDGLLSSVKELAVKFYEKKEVSTEVTLEKLDISENIQKLLAGAGITTIAELCEKSADEMLEIKFFGRGRLFSLLNALAHFELSLKG